MKDSSQCSVGTRVRTAAISVGHGALLSAWYGVVVVPDAQTFLHRAVNSRNSSTSHRVLDGTRSVLQFASLPVAAVSAAIGRSQVARIASFSVFANPPTVLITALIVHDVAQMLFGAIRRAMGGVSRLIVSDLDTQLDVPADTASTPPTADENASKSSLPAGTATGLPITANTVTDVNTA